MKTIDQIYHCQIPGQDFRTWPLRCHLRIFQTRSEVQTVIITDMAFELGWFMPCLVEKLVDQIVKDFQLDPAKLIWIEQYRSGFSRLTCADFSQVTFEWQNGQATNPQWQPIAPAVAQALISEDLQRLPA